MTTARKGRVAAGLTALALAWSVALLGFAATALPPLGIAFAAQPLLISALMWALLRRRCTTGSSGATAASRLIAFLYLPWSIVGAVTVAIGAFPAALLLAGAAAITPVPARAR
jgi:hypothetical protein